MKVIAYADDLHRPVQRVAEVGHHLGAELDGLALALHMRRGGVTDHPVLGGIDPRIQTVLHDDIVSLAGRRGIDGAGQHDGLVWVDEHPTIEPGDDAVQPQRLHQHGHSPRWPARGHGKADAGRLHPMHGSDGAVGHHLLLRHQGAINVGQEQFYVRPSHAGAPSFASLRPAPYRSS